ncbi:MAG TPA: D-glycerate dehydrogenase [Hyphomonadaceae bacterium]|nr:D-glycerate dehydrogenase [Hyphomonadaceae bacterium]
MTKKLGRLLVGLPMPAEVVERCKAEFDAYVTDNFLSLDDWVRIAHEQQSEAILSTFGRPLRKPDLDRFPPSLKIIATTSVGFDHIDIPAASARNIVIANTPDVVTDATADVTILLMLGALRRAKENMQIMAESWQRRNGFRDMLGWDMTGKTLGIVGMGRIGRAVAQRARGFDMPIIYHNRTRLPAELEHGAIYYDSLDAMLPRCQVLSLNLPGSGVTLMTREKFALLPKGAVFVNSARGSLVDEDALLEALTSGHLAAVGLDVFRKEPQFDQRFKDLPNAFLLPHIGTATIETRVSMGMRALDNIAAVLSGKPAPDEVRE